MRYNKTILWLLSLYIVLQLTSLFFKNSLALFAYPTIYLIAIIYAVIGCGKSIVRDGQIKSIIGPVIMFFIANLVLFIVYLPTLIFNPHINWTLKGEAEYDPMLLQAYVPPLFFLIAAVIILIVVLIAKLIRRFKIKGEFNS